MVISLKTLDRGVKMRSARKKEHIENYLRTSYKGDNLLGDIYLEHNALPDLDFKDIDISTKFLGKKIDAPIIINAMTGGTDFTQGINKDLASLAKSFNIPMAVGSQTIALEDENSFESFQVVRETIGPEGIVLSNLNGNSSVEDAKRAIELIDANALQIHLNPAQELVMEEGDRDFKAISNNIETIVKEIEVPVIVKEVGFGISKEVASKLYELGVRHVDIAGYGGTNFIEIENLRNHNIDLSEFYDWGIPTALSLIECRSLDKDLSLISSGGIRNSMDIVKSLILGASITGISGELLAYLVHGGYDNAEQYLTNLIYKIKVAMLLLGKANLSELKDTKYRVTGKLKMLLNQ